MSIKTLVASIASVGCLLFSAALTAEEAMKVARVVVEGPEFRVYKFNQNLFEILNAMFELDEGETLALSCGIGDEEKSCDELRASQERRNPVNVRYVTTRELEYMTAFVRTWSKLQDGGVNPVTMKFDMVVGSPDCSNPTQAIQPCYNASNCPFTTPRRCDKVPGQPCSSCGVPPAP